MLTWVKYKNKSGFSLVELLVVISIIALLLSILLPSLSYAMHSARTTRCNNNLKSLNQAIILYRNDNDGGGKRSGYISVSSDFPYSSIPRENELFHDKIKNYINPNHIFNIDTPEDPWACPSDNIKLATNVLGYYQFGFSYNYNIGFTEWYYNHHEVPTLPRNIKITTVLDLYPNTLVFYEYSIYHKYEKINGYKARFGIKLDGGIVKIPTEL